MQLVQLHVLGNADLGLGVFGDNAFGDVPHEIDGGRSVDYVDPVHPAS